MSTNNSNKPKLRFKGFSDDWEQRKLSDITNVYDGVHQTPDYQESGIMFLSVENIATLKSNKYISQEAFERDYKNYPEKGDILMTRIGDVGTPNVVETTEKVAFYVSLALLKPKNVDSYFLCNAICSSEFQRNLKNRTLVTAIPQKINKDEIGKVEFLMPQNTAEQKAIGAYFKNLDHLITLHQRKCDNLKIIKKSMLDNLFPKNGEKVPKWRFKGFNNDWEQRKLSDEFNEFIVPMRDKPKEFGGNIPWTRIEDIEGKYLNDSLLQQYVSEETVNQMNLKIIPKDSLIVSTSATFGVVAIVTQDLITNQTFIGLVPKEKETLNYWYIFFHSSEARRYMKLESAGSTIFYITRESFEKMPIMVPSKNEMYKLGTYFDNLDNLITLHQSEVERLKKAKQFFLDKMFI